MKGWFARWDVTPDEQASLSFGQLLTILNLRRVEIACVLGLFTKGLEFATGFRWRLMVVEMPLLVAFLLASIAMRRMANPPLARTFVATLALMALLGTQWTVAAMGAQGRLTSGYPMMMLSLALLFVVPPRIAWPALTVLFVTYTGIVIDTPTRAAEKSVAIFNTGITSVIAFVAVALIHAGRRRDYDQRREIRIQNAQLLDRNAELDTLMAITAHDLRSPLYGLRNLFDLAARRAAREPELPLVVLRQATASIDAMLALATRLLDAHAAEHRALAALVDEDVRSHVLAAAGRIGPLAQSADVRIDLDLPDRPLTAALDPGALAQILDNLLSNAVRFSPAGGTLTIGAARDGDHAAIRVRDRGPGIDPDRRVHLFRKFHRGSPAGSERMPGAGMGLFIIATLAARMQAAVRHEPAADGGSVFIVTLAAAE